MSELEDACKELYCEVIKLKGRLQREKEIAELNSQLAAVTAERDTLRREANMLLEGAFNVHAELETVAATADRYRKALERIETNVEDGQTLSGTDCRDIAREALDGKDEPAKDPFPTIPYMRKPKPMTCGDCAGTGWAGDNGPGIMGNSEFCRCDCGASEKCQFSAHRYVIIGGVPWCKTCNLEAYMEIEREHHAPNADAAEQERMRGMNAYEAQVMAIDAVRDERGRQDAKWGEQNHTPEWWLAILMEEVGELAQAILETHFNNPDGSPHGGVENILKEATHSCAVALAIIECIKRNKDK